MSQIFHIYTNVIIDNYNFFGNELNHALIVENEDINQKATPMDLREDVKFPQICKKVERIMDTENHLG